MSGSHSAGWTARTHGRHRSTRCQSSSSAPVPAGATGPTTVLDGDLEAALRALKSDVDGDIVVYASYQLVRALLTYDLVDELRLVVFPCVNGGGGRLFDDVGARLSLREVRQLGTSLVFLHYDVEAA